MLVPPLRLRHATPDDLPRLTDIYNASIPGGMATADERPLRPDERAGWFRAYAPERNPLYVLERDARVDAYLGLRPWSELPGYRVTAEVSVYVAPEARRAGLARTLLEHALAEAPRLGLRRLVARVFGHNEPSLRLFERHGFERWGLMPGVVELGGVARDVVMLGRAVDAP
ncbi:MAG TPA: GNAT family N-acetyltransferase [Candidatus Thermoplasmatota archaeon]|nr:GNAT family N-acetyltransferase [Candidatus Thermoplasmatota archaeon]